MSVNTTVYGESTSWNRANVSNFTEPEMNYYYANFGDQSTYDSSFLQAGVDNGKISLNEPIDKSLSWCGLGNNSTFSQMECYNNKPWEDTDDPFRMINKDSRSVTNFAIFGKVATGGPINADPSSWYYSDTSSTKYASRARWSPEAETGTSSSTRNFNMGLRPVTQMPMRNCVMVPCVECVENIDSVLSSTHTVVMWDYLDTTSDYNYTNCPYILTVTMQTWGHLNENDVQNARSNRGWGLENPHIAVIDETDACKNQPFNTLVPGYKQSGSYQYYAMGDVNNISGLVIMGTLSSNANYMLLPHNTSSYNSQTRGNLVLPHPNGQLKYLLNTSTSSTASDRVLYYITYYDGFQEWVRRQIACFGLFFTDDEQTAKYGAFDDENMFLGTLDGNNIGNGDYSRGSANRDQKQWNWSTTNNSEYNPDVKPDIDPNTYETTSGFNSVLNAPEGFNKRYVLSATDVRQLNTDFFRALQSKPEDVDYINYSMSEFLTNDPITAIVSLKWFPFTVPSYGNATPIKLGNYQTTVSAPYYTGSGVEVYNLGSFDLHPHYGKSFLDYEPYSKTSVVIPYCGTVQLDHSIYMGTTVSIHLIVDIYTGACTAQIKSDGLVVDSISGVCSVDLPISGIDNATLEGQIYNASLNLKSSKITEGTTVVAGGLSVGSSALGLLSGSQGKRIKSGLETVSALTSAIEGVNQSTKNLSQSKYDLSHVQIPFKSVGAQTGLSNAKFEQFCRVLLYRPVFLNGAQDLATWYDTAEAQSYAKTVGYATVKSGTLGSFTGFTVCSNADLSGIPATDTEKEQILNLLKSGVYM